MTTTTTGRRVHLCTSGHVAHRRTDPMIIYPVYVDTWTNLNMQPNEGYLKRLLLHNTLRWADRQAITRSWVACSVCLLGMESYLTRMLITAICSRLYTHVCVYKYSYLLSLVLLFFLGWGLLLVIVLSTILDLLRCHSSYLSPSERASADWPAPLRGRAQTPSP